MKDRIRVWGVGMGLLGGSEGCEGRGRGRGGSAASSCELAWWPGPLTLVGAVQVKTPDAANALPNPGTQARVARTPLESL